jgi:small subunit ribosomal protein S8
MNISDPISDLLTRIRNGQQAHKKAVDSPSSAQRLRLLDVLKDEGYIRGYTVNSSVKDKPQLTVELKYIDNVPVIKTIDRVSKPGRRVYSSIKTLAPVSNGLGINILSTSKGVMSDVNAKKLAIGGEVLCKVF